MNERDRVIDVIYPVLKDKIGYVSLCTAIEIADALLEKGVIVPPCPENLH